MVLRSISFPHHVNVSQQQPPWLTICRCRDGHTPVPHTAGTHNERQSCLLLKSPAPKSPRGVEGTLTRAQGTNHTPTSQHLPATQQVLDRAAASQEQNVNLNLHRVYEAKPNIPLSMGQCLHYASLLSHPLCFIITPYFNREIIMFRL